MGISLLIAVAGMSLLIVAHEAGHFVAARLCGMRVERFSIGFGKPLVSVKRGETIYQIAPIPMGGFVQITGLNPHDEFDRDDPMVYSNRPRWMRLIVMMAGPAANYLVAMLIAFAILMVYGKSVGQTAEIADVVPGSPAQAAGLQAKDLILEADGRTLTPDLQVTTVIRQSQGRPVNLKFRRDTAVRSVTITPRKEAGQQYFTIGIYPRPAYGPAPVGEAVKQAVTAPVILSGQILSGIWEMIVGKQAANLSGPVGITRYMAHAAERGGMEFLNLMMMLSTYLAIFNMLPLPALDGGRVLFLGISMLPVKRVNERTEATVHMVGLLLLLGVFVLVTLKDIKEIVLNML